MALNETPYIHSKATIDISSPAIDLSCMARTVSLVPSDASVDIATQCAPGAAAPGITTWTFTAEFLMSYDSTDAAGDGLWNQLNAIAKTEVSITVKPADATVDSTNPSATFNMYVPSIPFIDVQTLGDKMLVPFTGVTSSVPVFATS